ncbi:hypothetical protein [Frankia sp. Cr1]|uniref:hypothetical protein n=1 Tax=Frankia sp. Cr1 TaxID=3073931 RepID=UPI002AD3DB4C|nr:hypothetical protein [Frankia sp. Cr1]
MAYYVSSEDRLDAEEAEATRDMEPTHSPTCHGWLGTDHQGRPRPCLICRPWLRQRSRRSYDPYEKAPP